MTVQRARKRPFKMDLARLHALCEANYARLLRLFPDYEQGNSREFAVAEARVRLEVLERSRYTTFFRLHQSHGEARWLRHLTIDVRAYHDAGMLEVGAFQAHHQIQPRYSYPNANMFQQDEKLQQNQFLGDWLEHCLANGRVQQPVLPRRAGC
ncbi:DUF1249 domain-containing protein [Haliea sp. E1-2-M8]|uniref:DUF1249 domain-containing protein n=1 Tax=Haliea sp. E1-2-M8 TaxID=3064706 RepID=UPI0027208FB7|nr:DUF1249 domain-containing protein [Haliea sp. E1-2-M8]MDO8862766.1 DUF1249 domain-containing protein [Haliea sp. E1-2-M8]